MESARSLCTQNRRVVFVVVSSLLCSTNCSIMSSGMPWPHLFSNCISLFYVNSAPHECVWFLCRCVLVSMTLPSGHTAFMHSDTSCAEHTQCCGKVVPVRRHLSCSVSSGICIFLCSPSHSHTHTQTLSRHTHFALMSSSHSSSSHGGEMQLSCAIKVSQCQRNLASRPLQLLTGFRQSYKLFQLRYQ